MNILIFDKNTQKGEFNNRGYGKLTLIEKCEITEELNGRFDVELIVSLDDSKNKYLTKWAIIYVEGQLFRIINRVDNDLDNTTKVFAKHIFYDINYGFIEDQRAEGKTIEEAMQIGLPSDFKYFNVSSDILDTNTLYFVKNNGAENMFSIIERWNQGELVRDNFNIAINKSKGNDNGVTFTYKKIDAIEITEETEEVVTRLYPTGKDGISLQEKYIYIPNWNEEDYLPFHITREVCFEGAENEGDLRILAQKEAEKIGLSRVNFTIKVHDLINTTLYENMPDLMKVEVGDIVTIKHHKLNFRVKVKCIKKVNDIINNKLKLEFGQPSKTFFDGIDNSNVKFDIPDTSNLRNELFYYFNGADIKLKNKDIQLAAIKIATSVQTNLMCHVTINPLIEIEGLLKLRITINNKDIQFSPLIDLEQGYRMVSFSVPFIAVEGGQTQAVKLWGEFSGAGVIPANSLHFSITGQNVAMGLIKIEPFTGATFEHSIHKILPIPITKNPIVRHKNLKFNKCNNIHNFVLKFVVSKDNLNIKLNRVTILK